MVMVAIMAGVGFGLHLLGLAADRFARTRFWQQPLQQTGLGLNIIGPLLVIPGPPYLGKSSGQCHNPGLCWGVVPNHGRARPYLSFGLFGGGFNPGRLDTLAHLPRYRPTPALRTCP